MAATNKLASLRSICSSMKLANRFDIRPSFAIIPRSYYSDDSGCRLAIVNNKIKNVNLNFGKENYGAVFQFNGLNSSSRIGAPFLGMGNMISVHGFASSTGGKGSPMDLNGQAATNGGPIGVSDVGLSENDWGNKIKEVWQSSTGYTGEKAKEVSDQMMPHVQELLEKYPYIKDVIVPFGGTLVGTLLAWLVMPRILKQFHTYSSLGPASLLAGSSVWGAVPYEKSFWGALEDPIRYLITFMAFSQLTTLVAPTAIASQYIGQVWRGAFIISFVWFLQRWKTNVISRAIAAKSLQELHRDKLLTLDKFSSVGLFVIGLLALAEACGVPVQSILTVGGIGGVATAFAARDILGNVLSGLSVQISQPFSIGDMIKAGSVEGQVVEMGLTNTSLLTAEKFPVIVPNSLFSSQVIVNKSRAQYRAMTSKIPLQIDDFDKIPQISNAIMDMLKSHTSVFLEKESPYCCLSRVERSFSELTLGCNLKSMSKDKLMVAEQDILLKAVRIIKEHGAELGNTM
ncbi:ion channel [Lithospermum erythrorhizon]|uniref:Ion channel n=1 Tax=Lithospermum erythrorhizon TaxID=34254 RepID=A0AAV3PB14_LITER